VPGSIVVAEIVLWGAAGHFWTLVVGVQLFFFAFNLMEATPTTSVQKWPAAPHSTISATTIIPTQPTNTRFILLPSLVSKESPAGYKGTAMGLYSTSQFLGVAVGGRNTVCASK
jgi:hypothetical protein